MCSDSTGTASRGGRGSFWARWFHSHWRFGPIAFQAFVKLAYVFFALLFWFSLTNKLKPLPSGRLGAAVGEVRKLDIPAEEGYGKGGFPAWGIPPNGGLFFEIEVLSIKGKSAEL